MLPESFEKVCSIALVINELFKGAYLTHFSFEEAICAIALIRPTEAPVTRWRQRICRDLNGLFTRPQSFTGKYIEALDVVA
jgi:hypothetical protein